jgi:hypothetical protein
MRRAKIGLGVYVERPLLSYRGTRSNHCDTSKSKGKNMRLSHFFLFGISLFLLTGCAGKVNYTPPSTTSTAKNSITVDESVDRVWKTIIPSLGSSFFVINNIDKDSGFINLSYSGDPEKYIDCGMVESHVKNMRGERRYRFPAASAYEEYETFNNGQDLFFVKRKMDLEGRINIILQELSAEQTLVTVNTKYLVTKDATVTHVQGASQRLSDTITFNTNGSARFPQNTECVATGALEREVLKNLGI